MTPEEIEQIYTNIVPKQVIPNGIDLPTHALQPQLRLRGAKIPDLKIESLMAALVGQTRLLRLSCGISITNEDNRAVWAWCGELLVNAATRLPRDERDLHLEQLYSTAIHALQADQPIRPRISGSQNNEQQRFDDAMSLYSHHSKAIIDAGRLISLHLSFPLLEGVCKRWLRAFVDPNGEVLKDFSVLRQGQHPRKYKAGKPISNLQHLLLLLDAEITGTVLQQNLRKIAEVIVPGGTHEAGFKQVYDWRNAALHGAEAELVGATILNIAILIGLGLIAPKFEERRSLALESAQYYERSPHRAAWSHYPPSRSTH